jgi:MFS family permease
VVQTALFVLPLLLVVYGLAPTFWSSLVAFTAVGAGYIAVLSGLNTVVQVRAPVEVRGRVLGIYMVGLGIVYPVGAVLQGWIGDHIGVRAVTVAGAAILFGVMVAVAGIRPGIFSALGDPASPGRAGVVLPAKELP